MTNKTTKSALFTSSISLLLCFAMLLGTTFAWFTDSATSAGNRIQAGNLDVKLLMWNGSDYTDISEGTGDIFAAADVATNSNNTLWEPGKTQVVYLAIENAGNLDLKYNVDIKAYKDAANTVNEIDMTPAMRYAITPDAQNGTGVTSWDSANAKEVALGMNKTQSENVMLAKGQKHYFALSVHMLEDAGNEYQDASVLFDLIVSATQLNSENDSFGPDYDKSAENATLVSNTDELTAALAAGESVALAADIALGATDQVNVSGGILDGNGNTLNATASRIDGMECALNTRGGVIKDLTIIGPNARALGSGSNNVVTFVDDLYIDNVTIDNTYYALNGSINSNHSVYVTNSKINGWISYAGLDLLSFKNTTLAKGNTTCSYGIGYLVVYGDTLIENCTFEEFYMGVNKAALNGYVKPAKDAGTPYTLTINNSYYKTGSGSVKITADNFKTLLTDGNDARDFGRLLANVDIYVDGVRVQ